MRSGSVLSFPREGARPGVRPRSNTLSARIVEVVCDALLAGTLNPGDVLGTEASLAAEFDVSRVAIRDALKCLEAMGVVQIRVGAGGGARIANGNTQLFADVLAVQLRLIDATPAAIMDAQRAIETMTAELAARHATSEDLARLEALLDETATELDDVEAFTRSSFAFHVAIAEAAHNDVLKMQLLAMHFIAWPKKNPTLTPDVAAHVQDLHRQLFLLIKARDADGARELMSRHMKQIRARRVAERSDEHEGTDCC